LAARTPGEAVEEFLGPIKETLGCLTNEGFVARIRRPGGPHPAVFQRGVIALRRRDSRPSIRLGLSHTYSVVETEGERGFWRVSTAGWIYELADSDDNLIVAFHWHPGGHGRMTWPHIHAYGTHESEELHKLHPPTGRVSIESVVRFLIEDLGVIPRRASWRAILERNEHLFRERRTWS
jgi:hypothetical protein